MERLAGAGKASEGAETRVSVNERGDGGETDEGENENRIKIEAERNPHFSFQPADSMPRDQTISPDGFGRLSQLRAWRMMGG